MSRIDALTPELKKATRGIIPTYKGYALRVEQQAEARITAVMNPKEAEILGPAMGLAAKSQWVVKGVPHYATKAQIIHTLSQSSAGGWPGWTIRPTKTLTSAKSGTITWKVDAETEPPMKTITLNNYLITIEAYIEKTLAAKGGSLPPLRIVPKRLQHEISFGDIYEREYGDASELNDDDDGRVAMEVEVPKQDYGEQQDGLRASNIPCRQLAEQQVPQQEANASQQGSEAALLTMMKQQALLIESLQATIASLQAELQRMREASSHGSRDEDDKNL